VISTLDTPVCALLGCEVPVVLAGMGGVARSELVAAVTVAGGFGFLGMVRESADLIRSEIARVRAATPRAFGVNLVPAATSAKLLEAELDAVIAERVAAVTLFWDLRPDIVGRLRESGCLVLCQIGSVREAEEAAQAGAHILIAQGVEAGGHVRGAIGVSELVPAVVARVDVPVLAAGGIVDGQGLADALRWGAQGAVVGTGFLATRESFAHDYHKQRIVDAKPGETVHTQDFHLNWPSGAAVRVLPNSVTRGDRGNPFGGERQIIGEEEGRPILLFSTDSPLRNMSGDFEAMALYAGQGAGHITSVPPAADRLNAMVSEAKRILGIAEGAAAAIDVRIKRIYEKPVSRDGFRVLVDRLWPRGVKKDSAALDEWMLDIAPSAALREWLEHEPSRWAEFRQRYLAELDAQVPLLDALREHATRRRVTLLYAAKDKKRNHAVVLEEVLKTAPPAGQVSEANRG
jgi:nitronate monooxygenase